jgi:hypothetical protein
VTHWWARIAAKADGGEHSGWQGPDAAEDGLLADAQGARHLLARVRTHAREEEDAWPPPRPRSGQKCSTVPTVRGPNRLCEHWGDKRRVNGGWERF